MLSTIEHAHVTICVYDAIFSCPSINERIFQQVGVKEPLRWYLRGMAAVIQQDTDVWVSSPPPFQQHHHFFKIFTLDVTKQFYHRLHRHEGNSYTPHRSLYVNTKLSSDMAAAFFHDFMSQPSACTICPHYITQGKIHIS